MKPQTHREIEKIITVMLYILKRISSDGVGYQYRLFKILYLADKKALSSVGRPVCNEMYIKKEDGPSPSMAHDLLRRSRKPHEGRTFFDKEIGEIFEYNGWNTIRAKIEPVLNYLTPSDIGVIDRAIKEVKHKEEVAESRLALPFLDEDASGEKIIPNHDIAWQNAEMNAPISRRDMIIASGDLSMLSIFDEFEAFKTGLD